KQLFDEHNIRNPGVIINNDKTSQTQHLKFMPKSDDIIHDMYRMSLLRSCYPIKRYYLNTKSAFYLVATPHLAT
ncbi:hypothetical protein, partial [Pseudoalteromonas sp. S4389]|uniref:hypothetical protein n=1 Tax=Pseudoalteromonas sp. S4389 TaxID=579556 RepID=UPI001BB28859